MLVSLHFTVRIASPKIVPFGGNFRTEFLIHLGLNNLLLDVHNCLFCAVYIVVSFEQVREM